MSWSLAVPKLKRIKPTAKQLQKIKHWWKLARKANDLYYSRIGAIEREMSKDVGIKDMEIFHSDGEMAGVGNYDRTMALIQRGALE